MKDLASIQSAFQRAILEGDDCILAEVHGGAGATGKVRVDVYRSSHLGRLVDAVRSQNRVLAAYLGDAAFNTLARAYIDAIPSRSASLRALCRELPAFLADTKPYCDQPAIADLAQIAVALADACDSPDHASCTSSDLAAMPPGAWETLCLMPHPSIRRLDLHSNAAEIWSAFESGSALAELALRDAEANRLIVWRQHAIAKFRRLPANEAMLWDAASKGTPFGVLRAMLAAKGEPGYAIAMQRYLYAWAAQGLLSQVIARRPD
jgi:hypothetical protein